jgi:hypothetical protein
VPFMLRRLVRPLMRRLLPTPPLSNIGLLLLARALLSVSEPDESSSIRGGLCAPLNCCLFFLVGERVTGPKYPSFPLPTSDGVGLGLMTRGVLGIWYWRDDSMAERQQVGKYGSAGARMTPDRHERALATKSAMWDSKLGDSGRFETLR